MRFVTSDKNEAESGTHIDYCAEMNVGNLKLYQWILTTNPKLWIFTQFYDDNNFEPISLNCAPEEENNNLKEMITSLVTYITNYKCANKKPILIYLNLGKDVSVSSIINKPTLKNGEKI